ncbi:MAG TPA: single-stranded DNA-binding protein [Actinophytocola sp.]|uniref:single-stranded DNA-binding protein n=1 Tax=Actinophytocola sp. TaxID=1872138 RepID=UPI002DBD6A9A|nr:single-stranded DNA-binding protein [Actinophytocola sp.]HEU5471168.1 single-stranded DNA-binding protein [Actinophytocola sp.]
MFETYLTVIGRIISDVNQRTVSTGDKLCTFRIAANERRFDRDAQAWTDGDRLILEVACWRKLAENVAVSVFKGDQVVATGRVYLNEYEANGEMRSSLRLDAKAIGPNLSMCTAMVQRPAREGSGGDASAAAEPVAA